MRWPLLVMLAPLGCGAVVLLPAPTLRYNSSQTLTVGWEPAASVPAASFQLQLSVRRPGLPTFHVVRHVPASTYFLEWPDLPEDADCCFRIAAMTDAVPHFSEATCHSTCSCATANTSGDGGGGCASCALGGALIGAVLAVAGYVACLQRPEPQGCGKHAVSLARGLLGGTYSHVRTAEEAGLEMDDPRLPACADVGRTGTVLSAHGPPGATGLSTLDPPADMNGNDFELRWSSCSTRSYILEGVLPSLPPSAPDEIEAVLVERGFFCVAAGAVGTVHKLYFTGQLRGSSDWLMLELVLHWQAASVMATFRCDSPGRLAALAEEYASLLGRTMRTSLAHVRY